MLNRIDHRLRILFAHCLAVMLVVSASAETFEWDIEDQTVSVSVENWTLEKLLTKIAGETGWKVRYEPRIGATKISTTFSGLAPNRALRQMLNGLNYSLVRPASGPGQLAVYRLSDADATVTIEIEPATDDSHIIKNELIVRLGPDSGIDIDELAAELGAEVTGRIEELHTYLLKFPDEESANAARALLEAKEGVEAIDANFKVEQPKIPETAAPVVFGTSDFNLRAGAGGDGLVIALIDTAIQFDLLGPEKEFLLDPIQILGDPGELGNFPTHGTSMFETMINALAETLGDIGESNVRILPVDVFGANDTTSSFIIAEAIMQAVNSGADIANLSFGGPNSNPLTEDVIQFAHDQGVPFISSAGNDPSSDPMYPAAYPTTFSVSTPGMNSNETVDYLIKDESFFYIGPNRYRVTGTSPAAAKVTAIIAGIADENGISPNEAKDIMVGNSSPLATAP